MENEKQIKMLKTARGQIDGIIKMLDENRPCFDVSNQIMSSVAILKKVNTEILSSQISSCICKNDEQINDKKLNEIVSLIKKISK